MRLPSALTRAMVDHLGTTYFHQVWNASDDHGRANFPLAKAAERLQTGLIPVGQSVVGLPTTGKVFAVYQVPIDNFGRFVKLPSYEWVKDSDVLASDHVEISTYAASGRVIPQGAVYLRYSPLRGTVLVAIDRNYTSPCIGESYPELFMTVFYDTTRKTPTVSQLHKVSPTNTATTVRNLITQAVAQYPAGVFLTVNGWVYTAADLPSLVNGDIVQIVCDPDMVGYCELTVDDNQSGYYSDLYGEYREILHLPKLLNPNNVTITHDTLTLVVYDPVTGKGVYGHQLDSNAVESITHNDFSIPRASLQAFQQALGSQSVKVRIYVRYPTEAQLLTDEVNHLRDLYVLSDEEIKKQLVGLSLNQIVEWKADKLEKSAYLNLLYYFDRLGNPDLLARYTSAMGYYSVASTLAESMHFYTYKGSQVTISKPARLVDFPCQVIVYCDGLKVPDQYVGVTQRCHSIELGFKAGGWIQLGSRIAVYITEEGVHAPLTYNPTLASPSINVEHDDYRLVEIVNYAEPRSILGGTTSKGYRVVPVSPGDYNTTLNTDGSVRYKTSAAHYGKNFYLVPIYGLTTQEFNLDTLIANKQPIILALQISDINNQLLPLTAFETLEVYINGHRLIEGVDYKCSPIMGEHNDILQQLLEVSNQEYLNLSTIENLLEVVIHGNKVASVDKGYAISNKLHRTLPPMIWSPSCGRAFVRGKLIEKVSENGSTLISQDPLMDGSPYLLEWTIPYGVSKLMASQSPTNDENLRTRIYRVLKLTPPVYPELVVISDQYALYSPYLARIVSDVASGVLTIVDEAKDDAFLEQFDEYKWYLERDVILSSNNPLLDRRFVTLAAHYANLSVQNPQQMVLVQRLISLTLLPAQLAIDEVLI